MVSCKCSGPQRQPPNSPACPPSHCSSFRGASDHDLRCPPLCCVICRAALLAGPAHAQDPLHAKIDRLIDAKAKADGVTISAPADDAEFLRRVYLDFAGRIPPAEAAAQFLADTDPEKADETDRQAARSAGVSDADGRSVPRHADGAARRTRPSGRSTYASRFAKNKPWDAMAREILRADPKDAADVGASFFLAKRLENYGQNPVDYSGLTRDVGRLFLGKNFQCCECHDHLFVEDYKQQHFQGLHAFFKNAVPGEARDNPGRREADDREDELRLGVHQGDDEHRPGRARRR